MVTLTRSPKGNRPGGGVQTGGVAKSSTGGSWLQGHLALVAVLGVVLLVALGGGGYLLTSSGDTQDPGVAPPRRAAPRRTAATGPGTSSPTNSSASPAATPAASGTRGRNPFDRIDGPPMSTGGTPSPGTSDSTGSPDSPGSTGVPFPSPVVPTVTATTRVTSTRTATTTATAPSSTVYLGLYGWTAESLPMFRVNDVSYTPTPGSTFATSFLYVSSYTQGAATCAHVNYEGAPEDICEGEVRKLP